MNRVMHVGVIHGARPDGEDAADAYYAMQRRYGPADRRRDRELQEARRPCVDTARDALNEFAKQCHEVSTSAGSEPRSALVGRTAAAPAQAAEVDAYIGSLVKAGYRVWREHDQKRLRIESSWLQFEVDESTSDNISVGAIHGWSVFMDPCDPEIWTIRTYLSVMAAPPITTRKAGQNNKLLWESRMDWLGAQYETLVTANKVRPVIGIY